MCSDDICSCDLLPYVDCVNKKPLLDGQTSELENYRYWILWAGGRFLDVKPLCWAKPGDILAPRIVNPRTPKPYTPYNQVVIKEIRTGARKAIKKNPEQFEEETTPRSPPRRRCPISGDMPRVITICLATSTKFGFRGLPVGP